MQIYIKLTHLFPIKPFSTPWKHQKTIYLFYLSVCFSIFYLNEVQISIYLSIYLSIYIYIYISGQKWRSKMGVIYMYNRENNVPSRLSPQWLCGHLGTWCAYFIWHKLIHFSLLLNRAIQRMGNTPNILRPRCMEQDESHPHFIFYCQLSKVTLD